MMKKADSIRQLTGTASELECQRKGARYLSNNSVPNFCNSNSSYDIHISSASIRQCLVHKFGECVTELKSYKLVR